MGFFVVTASRRRLVAAAVAIVMSNEQSHLAPLVTPRNALAFRSAPQGGNGMRPVSASERDALQAFEQARAEQRAGLQARQRRGVRAHDAGQNTRSPGNRGRRRSVDDGQRGGSSRGRPVFRVVRRPETLGQLRHFRRILSSDTGTSLPTAAASASIWEEVVVDPSPKIVCTTSSKFSLPKIP